MLLKLCDEFSTSAYAYRSKRSDETVPLDAQMIE